LKNSEPLRLLLNLVDQVSKAKSIGRKKSLEAYVEYNAGFARV
jgi:hypothetical protein